MYDFNIIDRRKNPGGKNLSNRQRFIKHVKKWLSDRIKKAPHGPITGGRAMDDRPIEIPVDGIDEPNFEFDSSTGVWDRVLPGNKKFSAGDKIDKPKGGGSGAGENKVGQGDTEDTFVFSISRQEYLDLLFEDLELPDLVKKSEKAAVTWQKIRTGYVNEGPPPMIDLVRSYKNSLGRRLAIKKPLEKRIEALRESQEDAETLASLEKRVKRIPWMDPVDLRYKRFDKKPIPNTQAVMFCLMDVSGSMGEVEKEIAKRMFLLTYLFLHKRYKNVEIVFVKHTDKGSVTDEEDFFQGQTSGGTEISSGLVVIHDTIREKYPIDAWNIYVVQATDGDNSGEDNDYMTEKMRQLLPLVQYYVYCEIRTRDPELFAHHSTTVWDLMYHLHPGFRSLCLVMMSSVDQVIPTFRQIFGKK